MPAQGEPPGGAHIEALRVRVRGRVQGVGYRDACVRHARLLGIDGWVCNRDDGSVELLLQGVPDALAAMLGWLHDGVRYARVDSVDSAALAPMSLQGFERMPTH